MGCRSRLSQSVETEQQGGEAWRQCLHASVAPQARMVESELSEKLETEVSLPFDRLFASDVMSKPRAAASLAGVGVEIDEALRLAGLE